MQFMQSECGEAFIFPADVEAEYTNAMKKIRKGTKLPKTLDECEKMCAELEKELKEKVGDSSRYFG